MFSTNGFSRGLNKRKGPVNLTELEEFRQATDGKHFLQKKKEYYHGLRVSGKVLQSRDLFRKNAQVPFATSFRFIITGKFSEDDVGDDNSCGFIDPKTAFVNVMWHEYFGHDTTEADNFFKEHPNASRDKRTYKDPVAVGRILLKPMTIIEVVVTLPEPVERGEAVPPVSTSAGPVVPGHWVTFTNLVFNVKRQSSQAKFEATKVTTYACTPFEDYTKIAEFSLAFLPFPQLPDNMDPQTEEQAAILNEMDRQLSIFSKEKEAMGEYFLPVITSIKAEQVIETEQIEQLKSLLIFRNPDEAYQEFLTMTGLHVMPLKLHVGVGKSATNGVWNTITSTVNAAIFDEDGKKMRSASYLLRFSNPGALICKRLLLSSWFGCAITSRMIEQAGDSLIIYGTVDLAATLNAEQMVTPEGQRITDCTVVVNVSDMELDLVGAIKGAGIPLSLETTTLLLTKNNTIGTVDARKGDWTYKFDDHPDIVNFTETIIPPTAEYAYFMVAPLIPQNDVERFKDVCLQNFMGDAEKASDSLIKYLLSLPGQDVALWGKKVTRAEYKSKPYEAATIYGIHKSLLEKYVPPAPKTTDDRFRLLGKWRQEAAKFYSIELPNSEQIEQPSAQPVTARKGDIESENAEDLQHKVVEDEGDEEISQQKSKRVKRSKK